MNLYDRYTKPCIESVLKSVIDVPFRIFIIDNNSNDGTADKATQDFPNDVFVHRNDSNTGCAAGWNKGLDLASTMGFTHYLILNSDILISPIAMQNMYDRLEQGDKLLVAGLDISGECAIPEATLDATAGVCRKDYSEAPHPHFSCFMISIDTLNKVGWFNEVFYPAYFEDNDYHHRIKIIGGNEGAITITTAPFYHFGSKTQNEGLGIGNPVVRGDVFKQNEARFIQLWGSIPTKAEWQHPWNKQELSAYLNKDQTFEPLA